MSFYPEHDEVEFIIPFGRHAEFSEWLADKDAAWSERLAANSDGPRIFRVKRQPAMFSKARLCEGKIVGPTLSIDADDLRIVDVIVEDDGGFHRIDAVKLTVDGWKVRYDNGEWWTFDDDEKVNVLPR